MEDHRLYHRHTCLDPTSMWHYWYYAPRPEAGCYDPKAIIAAEDYRLASKAYHPCPDHDGLPNHERMN